MGDSKEVRHSKLHQEAIIRFNKISAGVKDEREQCLTDRRFCSISGAQYEGPLEGIFKDKPKFEVNKCHLAAIRIESEFRNNKIAVKFVSKTDKSEELAETLNGLYRADIADSNGDEAHDNAFGDGMRGGFSAWRLIAKYEDDSDEENERQRIRFEPIYDADSSVFYDTNSKRQDKSDANFCYVLTAMSYDAYKEEWGDDPASWPKDINQTQFDWIREDVVYVAEYYVVELKTKTIHFFEAIDGEEIKHDQKDLKDDPTIEENIIALGGQYKSSRKIKTKKIHKYIMSGAKILEDAGFIAGKRLPIIPYFGKRMVIDSTERCIGHVRFAKDAQRLKNMQLTSLAEIAAYSKIEKPILTAQQIAGHEKTWATDNLHDYPYLLINETTDADGNPITTNNINYTKPPAIPPATAALMALTETDLSDLLGNQQAAEEVRSNISGEAYQVIKDSLDMQTYIYISNYAKAIKTEAEVYLSMLKDIYVEEEREMKVLDPDGKRSMVTLGVKAVDDEGVPYLKNDLANADMDIEIEVGPSTSSKKSATVKRIVDMMGVTTDPETTQVLSAMAIMNMEGEGMSDLKDYFRNKLVRMGAVKPTEEEIEAMQAEQQAPDPNAELMTAMANQANAEAENQRMKAVETAQNANLKEAQTDKTKAETVETLSGIERDDYIAAQKIIDEEKENSLRPAVQVDEVTLGV